MFLAIAQGITQAFTLLVTFAVFIGLIVTPAVIMGNHVQKLITQKESLRKILYTAFPFTLFASLSLFAGTYFVLWIIGFLLPA